MFIYLIVNHETGKYYVGQHKGNNLKHYLQQKLYEAWHHNGRSYLYASMRKHSRDVWSIHALRSDIQTREELDETERDFIRFLKSQNPEYGYNICRGGEGFTGPHAPEFGVNQSRIMKEVWKRADFKEKMTKRKRRLGSKASDETRKKLRLSHLGICPTTEMVQKMHATRERLNIPMCSTKGLTFSEKIRKKMSESQSRRRLKEKELQKT